MRKSPKTPSGQLNKDLLRPGQHHQQLPPRVRPEAIPVKDGLHQNIKRPALRLLGLTKAYLFTYNTLNFLAWGTCVVYTASLLPDHVSTKTLPKVFGQTFSPLLLATQSLALLEVPAAAGVGDYGTVWWEIVGAGGIPSWVIMRIWDVFLLGALRGYPLWILCYYLVWELGSELVDVVTLTSFALTRYNTFYIFYPIGISSECTLIFHALGPAGELNPLFRYLLIAILVIYVPGSYVLYTHMISQRRKIMRGKKRAD
ncbi:hypothetical protein PDIDSM_5339 [Penicillium digitatum]|nr:hypothetical protein PDIDSM_5339 [Penicillium digitatum]